MLSEINKPSNTQNCVHREGILILSGNIQ